MPAIFIWKNNTGQHLPTEMGTIKNGSPVFFTTSSKSLYKGFETVMKRIATGEK